jgi:hypothetical protein
MTYINVDALVYIIVTIDVCKIIGAQGHAKVVANKVYTNLRYEMLLLTSAMYPKY